MHIALTEGDVSALYEQCVLGINTPTQLTSHMTYNEVTRFFKCALRTMIDLDGIMYKHELCIGPMSIDDQNEEQYNKMIAHIKGIRGDKKRLDKEFKKLADQLGMQITPVDNCTRLPIALMKACGWITSVPNRTLYNKSMICIQITKHGINLYNKIKQMKDVRLEEFMQYDSDIQDSLIRLGFFNMLSSSGYDLTAVSDIITADKSRCEFILNGREVLFSPYQTIRKAQIEKALGICTEIQNKVEYIDTGKIFKSQRNNIDMLRIPINLKHRSSFDSLTEQEDIEFISKINMLHKQNKSHSQIVNCLFGEYQSAKQSTFYPLVARLFKIIGFNCQFSRTGDNGARWDAIIIDEQRSIPIEIKSPTEELNISLKAIRQALENKIILLSRKTFITTPETTSLVVGYLMPNERAEVNNLINMISTTYGYKIGVIDLRSLLSIVVSIVLDNNTIDTEQIFSLEGLCDANI